MAVLTRDLLIASVHFVAEWNWLRWRVADIVDSVTRGIKPPGLRLISAEHEQR